MLLLAEAASFWFSELQNSRGANGPEPVSRRAEATETGGPTTAAVAEIIVPHRILSAQEPGKYALGPVQEGVANGSNPFPEMEVKKEPAPSGGVDNVLLLTWRSASALHIPVSYKLKLTSDDERFGAAWEFGAGSVWIVDKDCIRQVDFADPAAIREDTFGRNNNGGFHGLTKELEASLEKTFPVGRKDGSIGGNFGGERFTSAQTAAEWCLQGSVLDENGNPLPDTVVSATTEYKPNEVIATAAPDSSGHYVLRLTVDLETLSKFRGVSVQANCAGRREKKWNSGGQFTLLTRAGESVTPRESARPWVMDLRQTLGGGQFLGFITPSENWQTANFVMLRDPAIQAGQ